MRGYRIPSPQKTAVFQGKYNRLNMLGTRSNSDCGINDRPHEHITIKAQGFWLKCQIRCTLPREDTAWRGQKPG